MSMVDLYRLPITRFEDLSNELLYEIFDYFDYYYIYEIFSNLNIRFNQLIIHSSLSLKLNLSLLSKATFQHQCHTILLRNKHRINSIHLLNHLSIEYFFKSFPLDSSYIRLEVLTLHNLRADHLASILITLTSLPRLLFLTLISIEKIRSRNIIHSFLFRLPVLKYCKLSLDILDHHFYTSLDNYEFSSIEHLVIDTKYNLNELINLLIYTPQLNRLSCQISTLNSSLSDISIVPKNLNHIYLQLEDTSFDEFEWFISYFSHQLQVLRISTKHDIEFLNADRWQRLITQKMPILHKFMFQYQMILRENNDQYHQLIEKFSSSFWYNKQWFFTHQHYRSKDLHPWIRFYSTQPYKWNHYELYEDTCQYQETGINLAYEVNFHNYQTTTLRFPRATRLILSEENIIGNQSFISDLTSVFSSIKLTELIIYDEQLRLEQLLSLLHHFPNIKSLTIPTNILNLSSPQSETNRLKFHTNNINKITIINRCTLEDIQILNRFCPYLQNLEIEVERENLELITRFLLIKNTNRTVRNQLLTHSYTKNLLLWQKEYSDCIHCTKTQNIYSFRSPCNHHLSSICFRDINYRMIDKLRIMINQEILLDDYSIEYIDQKMFLWW